MINTLQLLAQKDMHKDSLYVTCVTLKWAPVVLFMKFLVLVSSYIVWPTLFTLNKWTSRDEFTIVVKASSAIFLTNITTFVN